MARGKETCKILREIRRQIAEANDIEFITSECRFKGECPGTCPKCEAELRYLEEQLKERRLAGKAVSLVGLSAGMLLFYGCGGTSEIPMRMGTETVNHEIRKDSVNIKEALFGEIVETQPEFKDGPEALKRFITKNLKYPETEGCVQGRVIVSFCVDTLGQVSDPKIVKGLDPAFDQEALRVVSILPEFIPGTYKGRKVRSRLMIPVTFRVPEDL
jgi:tonB family C-terminal domain